MRSWCWMTARPGAARAPAVLADERGAIALLAVFMAIFGLAILYSFIGSFAALSFREGMQDAADAAAFDAAVVHARGMNFIVLINIVMAALMAVLITIKLLEGLCILGMVLAAALAWPTFGASLALLPPLAAAEHSLEEAYEPTKTAVDQANGILNMTAGAVAAAVPLIADGIVTAELLAKNLPPAESGLVVSALGSAGGVPRLPVEDDSFDALCTHGQETVAGVLTAPIAALDPTDLVSGALEGVATEMMGAMASWLCDGGSSQSPSLAKTVTRVHPRTDDAALCEDQDGGSDDARHAGQEAACERVRAFEQASAPDPATGACGEHSECRLGGAYDERVYLARSQCAPTANPAPVMYWYELREGRVTYTWDPKNNLWIRGEPTFAAPTAFPPNLTLSTDPNASAVAAPAPIPPEAKIPPCGPEAMQPRVGTGYNLTLRNSNDVNDVLPVCSNEKPPLLPDVTGREASVEVRFTEVVNILGCQTEEHAHFSTGGGSAATNDSAHTPKRVLASAKLGDESFLVRSFMRGSFDAGSAGHLVRLALHGRKPPADPLSALAPLRNYSVAAAEYYFNGTDGPDEWLWKMKWRARFRRFRVPQGGLGDVLGGFCSGEPCSGALGLVERMGDVIAH